MKVGFIDYFLMNPLGLRRLPLLFADLLDRVQMNEGTFLVADDDIKQPISIHIACRAHSAAFVCPNSAPIRTELIQYDSGGFLRQSLNQFGFGHFHMGSDTFSNIPITKRIRDIVSLGSSLDIKSHIEIKDYGLSNTALPFPYSDHTVNFQTM